MIRARPLIAAMLCMGIAAPLSGQTDIFNLTETEKQLLGRAIRDVLIATPELLQTDGPTMAAGYDAEITSDLALIQQNHAALFDAGLPGAGNDGARLKIAFFTAPDCADCAQAQQELSALTRHHDLRVHVIDVTTHPDLAQGLGVDTLPFYVLPRMMLRGAMPAPVLDGYMANATGQ